MPRVRVFIATSVDGFIAGPDDEIDWLAGGEGAQDTFGPFMAQIGALLMGRRTYDVVEGLDSWPYGDTPVLVATRRALETDRSTVRAVDGEVEDCIAAAKQAAGDKDVYIDGGRLIRSALAAGLVDDITVTFIPIILGRGIPLFAGATERHPLELISTRDVGGGLVEVTYRPRAGQHAPG